MKTKNIVFSVFTFALFAAPLLAQEIGNYDYHEFEHKQKISTSLKQIHQNTVNKDKYLDVGTLYNYLKEDLPIDLDKLQTKATNSIKDNKITQQEQYTLMLYCVEHNEKDVLETLLKAGFNILLTDEKVIPYYLSLDNKAFDSGNDNIAKFLIKYVSNNYNIKINDTIKK